MTDESSRSVTFLLEPDDYIAANRLHARLIYRRPWWRAWFACLFIFSVMFFYYSWKNPPETTLDIIIFLAMIFAISLPLLRHLLYLPYRTRKVFQEQKSLHYPVTVSWSPDSIKVENQSGSSATPWDDLFRWGEDNRMLLLYHSSRLFHMLPKRVLTEAQVADLRQFIKVPTL